jgi:hypothetical protein
MYYQIYIPDSDEEMEELYADLPLPQNTRVISYPAGTSTWVEQPPQAAIATVGTTSNTRKKLAQLSESPSFKPAVSPHTSTPSDIGSSNSGPSYNSESFEWSGHLRRCMDEVFGDQILTPSLLR